MGNRKKGLRSAGSKHPDTERLELSNILREVRRPAQMADMPRRIKLSQRALELVSRRQNPILWAELQNGLANGLARSPIGNRADNIEQAIMHYIEALEVYKEKDLPIDWANTCSNLALAFINRIKGNRADNIEQAINYCNQALNICIEKRSPESWAKIHSNLGLIYTKRIRGDRSDNIEQAIYHCNQALKVYTRKDFFWASIQGNLAITYFRRIKGERAENIEQSILHCEEALKVYTEKNFPEDWAMTENNLANAYSDRIRGDRAENIERAIEHYNEALKVYTQKDFPQYWAGTQNNLANAYINRISGDRAENIEQAIEHCKEALKVYTQKDFPEDWAMTKNNLALAYYNRIRGDRAENIEQAIEHCQQSLKVYSARDYPRRCRGTAYLLGDIYLEVQRYSPASDAYSTAMEAAEELYRASIFQASREAELAETRDLYRRAGYALAKSNKLKDAAVALERGRARGLGEALARDRADLERVEEMDPEAFKLYSQAVEELQNLESQERKGESAEGKTSPTLRDLMTQARARLDGAVDRIRRIPGYESFLAEPGWEDIAAAVAPGQPLVYIAAAPKGGLALIVNRASDSKDASIETVPLESFSEERLQEHINTWFEAYYGWQKALRNLIEYKIEVKEYLQAKKRWFDGIEAVTGQLWQEVAEPIHSALKPLKPENAFLIPTGLLALLPLHAAWRADGSKKEYLQDLLPLSYIPSARALVHARRNSIGEDRLLAIDEPRPVNASHLKNSHAEVLAISSHFKNSETVLEHEKATRSAVLEALPKAQVAHFSCHGRADWTDPEKSGLIMANDEVLTIKDLFELHLLGARLATLSACETGLPGARLPDEVVSLPSAFIRAGFAGAIGSLWTVWDDSTAQLMTSFYQLWRAEGKTPVLALAGALKELREQENFRHPFYWAAFYMTGI